MQPPDVSYARSGDVAIAYQIVGAGPSDFVFIRGEHQLKGVPEPWRLYAVMPSVLR